VIGYALREAALTSKMVGQGAALGRSVSHGVAERTMGASRWGPPRSGVPALPAAPPKAPARRITGSPVSGA
jgi:hypothetical protein